SGLGIEIAGASVPLSSLGLSGEIPVNTTVDLSVAGLAGVILHLKEETVVGDGFGGYVLSRTALRVEITALNVNLGLLNGGLQTLSGEIVVGHSEARQVGDSDGDGIADLFDGDADGDGITDEVEIANAGSGGDTDGDGIADHYDLDSDDDAINDVIEGGGTDVDGNGRQDGTADADGDGIVNTADADEGGSALPVPDTDGDLAPDYLDLDSDNDSLSDLVESGEPVVDSDFNGVADGPDADRDGIKDSADLLVGFGDASSGSGYPDHDGDGTIDAAEIDRDDDGVFDLVGTGNESFDQNNDGRIDPVGDADSDGIDDSVDFQLPQFGGLTDPFADLDGDGIPNGSEGNLRRDTDGDGIPDALDADSDADGIPDLAEGGLDPDGDALANFIDLDSDGDGINDVAEGGGSDVDGNGRQDGTADTDGDGIVNTADPDEGGTPLPLPDTDGDLARDFLDLDSDNDTLPDVLESGNWAHDADGDGITEGEDADADGLTAGVDGLIAEFGDAGSGALQDTDGDGTPDYIDAFSSGGEIADISTTANGGLDADGDGMIDLPVADADHDGVADGVDDAADVFGGAGSPKVPVLRWADENFEPDGATSPGFEWLGDPDHDGHTNLEEYFGGSDPNDPASTPGLAVSIEPNGEGGYRHLTVNAQRDPTAYAFAIVEVSTDLLGWASDAGSVVTLSSTHSELIARAVAAVGPDSPRGFIRLRIVVPGITAAP
ncbi:MAG: hypothetical protein R3F11_32505, partial [Verrucomicrobiales bacterium]